MKHSSRRSLLSRLGATGLGALLTVPWQVAWAGPVSSSAETDGQTDPLHEHDRWLEPLSARHRQLIDVVQPVGTNGFNYALTFLYANAESYNRRDDEVNIVLVLRDRASVLAMSDAIWSEYRIGEHFGVTDPATKAPALRNIHARRGAAAPTVSAAVDALQQRGVTIVACGTALRTHAAQTARRIGLDPAVARDTWVKAVLPGVVLVPAGIIAVNAAQRRGFAYASAG
jgi:intracellular sulfur oxidation DsrE/DsrF family protein